MEHPLAPLRYSTIAPSHRERPIKQGRADRTVDWTAPEGGEEGSEMGSGEVMGGRRRQGGWLGRVSQQGAT